MKIFGKINLRILPKQKKFFAKNEQPIEKEAES